MLTIAVSRTAARSNTLPIASLRSFGNDAGHFLGNDHFFLTGIGTPFKSEFHARAMAFFVNAVRATTAVAVAASALRANGPLLYMLTSLFLSMIVFPFATHW